MVRKSHQCTADSIAKEFQTFTGVNVSAKTVQRELHEMGSPSPMPSVGWSGVGHTVTGL